MNSPAPDELENGDDDIDWDLWEESFGEVAAETIVDPITADSRPRWLIYALGHLLWMGVVYGLLARYGQLVPYIVLILAFGSGIGLFSLHRSRWRFAGWFVWLIAVVGVCRWLTLGGGNEPPWWIGPSLIIVIVVVAYVLWGWGRMRLKRERPKPPLIFE
ncbi:hypothetical protein OVA11_16015 [Caulobacter sp. SL161]|uniref:hypothetical protein n=1 Tax=Caulobacter sp. SL161 TaxID=2995156 RepID=UPI002272E313|nr:hypothetical protein [Caulobacter sp. SL161]MCY1648515.1 hypothetical protein [Caulobacter sp. SL161]